MQINSIQSYRQQAKNTPSFGSVKIAQKPQALYQINDAKTLKKYIEHSKRLENMKINLTEIIKSWKLTPSMIYVLKNFLDLIGKDEAHNFTVNFEDYDTPSVSFLEHDARRRSSMMDFIKYEHLTTYHIPIFKSFWGYSVNNIYNDKKLHLSGNIKNYEKFQLPTERLILSAVSQVLKNDIQVMAKAVDSNCRILEQREELKKIRSEYGEVREKEYDYLKIYPKKSFPVSSLVCTLDDIIYYVNKHKVWNDYSQVYKINYDPFNKRVTKDGETLLIALAHVLPTSENTEKYAKFIDELSRGLGLQINFNQKDSMGIPFIEHVLNSKNMFLLTLAAQAEDLIYEPELENVFNSIKDDKFKETVLELDIFNNLYNLKYKTIFGQPNPNLKNYGEI